MIIREFFRTRSDGVNLYRCYSDLGLKLRNENGVLYDEPIDIENTVHTYTESDVPVEDYISDEEALDIILGRDGHDNTDESIGDQA